MKRSKVVTGSMPSSSAKITWPEPQTSRPAKANKSMSAEFVVDSDDDDDQGRSIKPTKQDVNPTNPRGAAPKLTAAKQNGLSAEQSKKRKSPSAAPTKIVANGSGTVKDSQDYTSTGGDDDGSSSSRKSTLSPVNSTALAPARAAQAKDQKPTVSSGATSHKVSTPPTTKSNKRKEAVNVSSEDGESSVGRSSEGESEDESASSDKTSPQTPTINHSAHNTTLQSAKLPYEPPPGFEPASISLHPSSTLSEILAPSNLVGKQLWHITVPASVPVSAIKDFPASSIQSGDPILSYKGAEYGLVAESGVVASSGGILLPSSRTNDYRPCGTPILKTLHLQQLVKLPNRAHQPPDTSNPTSKPQTHVKIVRQQPQGLKMRYHAFGASESSDSDVSAPAAQAPKFRVPDLPARSTKKRKLSNSVADSAEASPAKAKKRKAGHDLPVAAESTVVDVNSPTSGNLKESNLSNIAPTTDVHTAVVHEVQSSTEKQRKKDAKRYEKQALPAVSQSIIPTDLAREAETLMPEEVVNIDAGINQVLPEEDRKAAKARRKQDRRSGKGTEKTTPPKSVEEPLAKSNDVSQRQSKSQSEKQSVQLSMPIHSSQENSAATAHNNHSMPQTSRQSTPHEKAKEEKAKRKEEKRKRKIASDFY